MHTMYLPYFFYRYVLIIRYISVVKPEPDFLAGAGAGAGEKAPDPAPGCGCLA